MAPAKPPQSSTSPKASPPNMSQPFPSTESRIPRQYVRIPKDQDNLLSKAGAWATTGFANVPSEVLQNLKDFHTKKNSPSSRQQRRSSASSSAGSSSSSSTSPPGRTVPSKNELPQHGKEGDEEDGASDDESVASWATSPDRERQAPRAAPQQRPPPSSSPSHPPRSLPPRPSPARSPEHPRPRPKAVLRVPPMNSFPSSSLGSDGEMDVELPLAITDVADPVKSVMHVVQPAPTPPSAQVQIVPCTYNDKTSPVKPPKPPAQQPHPRRRMKEIVFNDTQADPDTPPQPTAAGLRPSALSLESQTAGLASSSLNFATTGLDGNQLPQASPSLAKRKYSMIESSQDETGVRDAGSRQNGLSSSEKLPPNGPASQVPYTAFGLQYPEYTGTLGDFVKALICIQDLQQHRALPEFLYDDFIRIFSEDYLVYIGELDDTTNALTAIQWYNEHVHQPVYTKQVITRTTLKNAVESYSEEFRAVRRSLGSRRRSIVSPDPEPCATGSESTSPPAATQDELPHAIDVVQGTGELGSDPIQSTAVPWPQNGSPSHPEQQGEAVDNIPFQVDRSPEITFAKPAQRPSRRSEPYQATISDKSPKIRSQVAVAIDLTAGSSPPSRQGRSPWVPSATAPYARTDTIPETAIKPKVVPRHSLDSTANPSPTQKFIHSKVTDEDPAHRTARFTKFLKKREKRLQSSAPPSSIADSVR